MGERRPVAASDKGGAIRGDLEGLLHKCEEPVNPVGAGFQSGIKNPAPHRRNLPALPTAADRPFQPLAERAGRRSAYAYMYSSIERNSGGIPPASSARKDSWAFRSVVESSERGGAGFSAATGKPVSPYA
jgi:hypothetical protein